MMDERQGIISLGRQLDRAEKSVFRLVVMATDHGLPPQRSTAEVVITVTVSNNAPPKFVSEEMVKELKVCILGYAMCVTTGSQLGWINLLDGYNRLEMHKDALEKLLISLVCHSVLLFIQ